MNKKNLKEFTADSNRKVPEVLQKYEFLLKGINRRFMALPIEVYVLIEHNSQKKHPKPVHDLDYYIDYFVEFDNDGNVIDVDTDRLNDVMIQVKYYLKGRKSWEKAMQGTGFESYYSEKLINYKDSCGK